MEIKDSFGEILYSLQLSQFTVWLYTRQGPASIPLKGSCESQRRIYRLAYVWRFE